MSPIIEVVQGSVTDADVDVLVNASNTMGQLGSGVSAAIRRACGPAFQETINAALATRGGSMDCGDALVTHAGDHARARFVVHVAVMDYRPGAVHRAPDAARIEKGTRGVWHVVECELPAKSGGYSIGMVALGAGTGALGERLPTEIACATLLEASSSAAAASSAASASASSAAAASSSAASSSRIARVVFHGFSVVEYINVADVVTRFFPDVAVPDDVRAHIEHMRTLT